MHIFELYEHVYFTLLYIYIYINLYIFERERKCSLWKNCRYMNAKKVKYKIKKMLLLNNFDLKLLNKEQHAIKQKLYVYKYFYTWHTESFLFSPGNVMHNPWAVHISQLLLLWPKLYSGEYLERTGGNWGLPRWLTG